MSRRSNLLTIEFNQKNIKREKYIKMTNIRKIILSALTSTLVVARAMGQDVVVNPEINYAGAPRTLEIGGLVTSGVEGYEDYMLTGISG